MKQKIINQDQFLLKGRRFSAALFFVIFIVLMLSVGAFFSDIYFLYGGLSLLSIPMALAIVYYFTKRFTIQLTANSILIKKHCFGIPFSKVAGKYTCFDFKNNSIVFYENEGDQLHPNKYVATLGLLSDGRISYRSPTSQGKSISMNSSEIESEVYQEITNFLFSQAHRNKVVFLGSNFTPNSPFDSEVST